jgi:molecular chaperone DnaK
LLLDSICDSFKRKHGVDLRQTPTAKARVLRAAEEAKKRLSNDAVTTVEEEFIAEKDGKSLNLVMEIARHEYEELIQPLLFKTLTCLDAALSDAMLQAHQVDKVVLVGGATRTPLIHNLLEERLGRPVHCEIEPDLAVAMGAAVQGGLIAGIDVGPILVDITPHTLGISTLGDLHGFRSPHAFSPIIPRNTSLPAFRTEIYSTVCDDQDAAEIRVFQGEDNDTRYNTLVGEFTIEGLAEVPAGNQIMVRLDLDLNGILKVTATERGTGLAKHVVIDNAIERFRARQRSDAVDRLESVLGIASSPFDQPAELIIPGVDNEFGESNEGPIDPALLEAIESAEDLAAKARAVMSSANAQDAEELQNLLADVDAAIARQDEPELRSILRKVEDLVFYLQDA